MTVSLLLTRRVPRDVMALAKALAAARRTPFHDQMIAARGAWGIVAEGLPEGEAAALGAALGASGVETLALPAARVAELPEAEPAATRADLPAAAPSLIAVGGMVVTSQSSRMVKEGPNKAERIMSTAIMMTTGLPIKIGGRSRPVEKTEQQQDLVFHADLLYREPARRLRIATRFDYSCLGERMLYHAQGNLKLLVGDLAATAPDAWLNHGAGILLEGKPMQTMGYGSLADLEREERWLLTLQALGR